MDADFIVILISVPSHEVGKAIGLALVEQRLAACANLLPELYSIYRWQGQIETADEMLLIIKSRAELFSQIAALVAELHPYEVPEVIALPVIAGTEKYLQWWRDETG